MKIAVIATILTASFLAISSPASATSVITAVGGQCTGLVDVGCTCHQSTGHCYRGADCTVHIWISFSGDCIVG